MLSRRNLFSMLTMMAVLFLLYMLIWVYQEYITDYNTNEYIEETSIRLSDVKKASDQTVIEQRKTAFIGNEENDMGNMVAQWCSYAKRSLQTFPSLKEYLAQGDSDTEVLYIAPDGLSLPDDLELLTELIEHEITIIFGSIPDAETMEKIPRLRELLGIEEIRSKKTGLSALYMPEGFLLGGEVLYEKTVEDWKFNVSIPWYQLGGTTNPYIIGLSEDAPEGMLLDEQPVILWRNTIENATIFAVNGNYMNDETGLGFLEAMMTASHTYSLYPVINAQNLTVADYPSFSSENEEKITEVYATNHKMLFQNILWPSLLSIASQSEFRLTCFLTPQQSYTDGTEPQTDDYPFYLQQVKRQRGEMGWSANSIDSISVAEKWKRDEEFFTEAENQYAYAAAYVPKEKQQELFSFSENNGSLELRTATGYKEDDGFLLSFPTDNMTFQGITHNADTYTYRDDLRNRSLQTALAYTNVLLELERIAWPDSEEDQWEKYSKKVAGNISGWWKPYFQFDKTTLTESDSRLRSFFLLDYEDEMTDNEIKLKVNNRQGTVTFLLRTHNADVKSVSGGTVTKIESDAWLISVEEDDVRIKLARNWH